MYSGMEVSHFHIRKHRSPSGSPSLWFTLPAIYCDNLGTSLRVSHAICSKTIWDITPHYLFGKVFLSWKIAEPCISLGSPQWGALENTMKIVFFKYKNGWFSTLFRIVLNYPKLGFPIHFNHEYNVWLYDTMYVILSCSLKIYKNKTLKFWP